MDASIDEQQADAPDDADFDESWEGCTRCS